MSFKKPQSGKQNTSGYQKQPLDEKFALKSFLKTLINIPVKYSKEFDPEGKRILADLMLDPIYDLMKESTVKEVLAQLYDLKELNAFNSFRFSVKQFKNLTEKYTKDPDIKRVSLEFIENVLEPAIEKFKAIHE